MPETLMWGLLSTARINRKIIPAIRVTRGATLMAVASRTKERAEEYASEHGIPRAYGSYEELLADPKVDCIYNPLPNALHAEWTIRALEAGKHVLCEKPFTANAAEAERVAEVARKTGGLVMEAFMYRFHPQWMHVRTIVERGDLGRLRVVRAEFGFNLTDPSNVRLQPGLAGGALMDVGCYCLNVCRLVTGAEPTWVVAAAEYDPTSGVDLATSAILRFPDEVFGELSCSFRTNYRHSVDIVGEEATLHIAHPWTPGPDQEVTLSINRNDRIEWVHISPADEYAMEVAHFCAAVRGEEPLRWGVDDALAQMRAMDAIAESARRGAPVTL